MHETIPRPPEPDTPALPWVLRPLFKHLNHIEHGRLLITGPGGTRLELAGTTSPELAGELRIHHPYRFMLRLLRGSLGFGEGYLASDWTSPDLPDLLRLLARNERAWSGGRKQPLHPLAFLDRIRHRRNRNTRRGSRHNIRDHYDLGVDFFKPWLDPTLTYSCAHFGTETDDLETAQRHKHRHALDRLDARPHQTLLEIGSGFGALAFAAAARGLYVESLTLSRSQLDYARAETEKRGLKDRVHFDFLDYRDLLGTYDHIVSIEMFEAVGEHYWPDFFGTLRSHLNPGGRVALQVIVIAPEAFEAYRRHPDFIQLHVFPGGMLPTFAHLETLATRSGFRIVEPTFHGADYARTLRCWLQRFDEAWPKLAAAGYPERLRRLWRYYFAYCIAGFEVKRVDVVQLTLVPSGRPPVSL